MAGKWMNVLFCSLHRWRTSSKTLSGEKREDRPRVAQTPGSTKHNGFPASQTERAASQYRATEEEEAFHSRFLARQGIAG
jgi:hypothetical protein